MSTTTTDRINGQWGGAAIKTPCRVATTVAITLSGTQTIDGVAVVADDRVLVKNQSSGIDNGIYVAGASDWERAKDFDGSKDIVNGTLVKVNAGSTTSGFWYVSGTDPITIDTTSITFVQASSVLAVFSAFIQTLLASSDAATFMTNLGMSSYFQTLTDDASATVARATLGMALTTKGDLLGGTGSSAVARLPVGTDGQILTALSAATAGIGYTSPGFISNGYLSASVATSAMTISLLTAAGATPSTTDPVYVYFRNATSGTGTPSTLSVTSATTLVISSGSTLGTASATANRVWVVGFNDAGTFRLGAINCSMSDGVASIMDDTLASSTAEGGAGAADSAGVIYTGTAVTTKAMRVLGYVESTQAVAGTWATTPSKVQVWSTGMHLPGDRVQYRRTSSGAVATGTTVIPTDDSIPQIGEGDQYLSQAITPTSAQNRFRINCLLHVVSSSANAVLNGALFQDLTANAIVAQTVYGEASGGTLRSMYLAHEMACGTTSATTFKIRAGPSAGTLTVNGAGGAREFGGVYFSHLEVEEVMA